MNGLLRDFNRAQSRRWLKRARGGPAFVLAELKTAEGKTIGVKAMTLCAG